MSSVVESSEINGCAIMALEGMRAALRRRTSTTATTATSSTAPITLPSTAPTTVSLLEELDEEPAEAAALSPVMLATGDAAVTTVHGVVIQGCITTTACTAGGMVSQNTPNNNNK